MRIRATFRAACALTMLCQCAFAEEARYAVHIPHRATAGTVERVLRGAARRLEQPRCGEIFDVFRDGTGQPLREALATTGRTAPQYLSLLIFYDGSRHRRCQDRRTLAVTNVGSRIVWICPAQFARVARRQVKAAEATLIHEALHTLGLGENPPSSMEITATVVSACRQ